MVIASSIPTMDKEMEDAAIHALQNEMLVGGESVEKFEEEFAAYVGRKHAIALASGTDALVIALRCLGITKRVITTPMTFVATPESIVLAGAKPAFADIDDTWTIDPKEIEKQIDDDVEAIMPVHLYGLPAKMDEIMSIAEKHDLKVIEDCAQAHGSTIGNKKVGTFGDIGCFSFYSTKNMTVGGNGGMIVTDDDAVAEKARLLREHGGSNEAQYVGYNARINTVNAAIGRVQLQRLDTWIEKRRKLAETYYSLTKKWGVKTVPVMEGHTYHLYVIQSEKRDELKQHLRKSKIFCGIHYPKAMHELAPYAKYAKRSYPKAEEHARTCLSLPMYPGLTDEEFKKVCTEIDAFFEGEQ